MPTCKYSGDAALSTCYPRQEGVTDAYEELTNLWFCPLLCSESFVHLSYKYLLKGAHTPGRMSTSFATHKIMPSPPAVIFSSKNQR